MRMQADPLQSMTERLEHELPHVTMSTARAFLEAAPSDAFLRPAVQAIYDHEESIHTLFHNNEAILAQLDRVLSIPQLPIPWRIALLNNISQRLVLMHLQKERQNIDALLSDLISSDMGHPFQLIPIRNSLISAHVLRQAEQGDAALAAANKLLQAHPESDAALEFQIQELSWRRLRHDFHGLHQTWQQLEQRATELKQRTGVHWAVQYGLFCAAAGRRLEIEQLLKSDHEQEMGMHSRLECLLALDRCDEAVAMIEELDVHPSLSAHALTYITIEGNIALLRRDMGALRRQIQRIQAWGGQRSAEYYFRLNHLAIQLALCERQPHQALQLLERVDPDHNFGDCYVEWARAWYLQGNKDAAAQALALAAARGEPQYVSHRLRLACELRADEVLELWQSAQQQRSPSEEMTPRRSGPRPVNLGLHQMDGDLVGDSPAMRLARERLQLLAQREEPVLIYGETGCGKEIAARCLHRNGPRSAQPLSTINCAGLPESLAEAELFGHVRGAFTGADHGRQGIFANAAGGTVVLDEICSLPLRLQGLMLRVLESGDFTPLGGSQPQRLQARIIAVSNRPLASLVAAGQFRQDLFYRINRLSLSLPPLREHRSDIPQLVHYFLDLMMGSETPRPHIAPDLWQVWETHPWPGNVRELRNEIESIWVLHGTAVIWRREHSSLALEISQTAELDKGDSPLPAPRGPQQISIPGAGRALDRRRQIMSFLTDRGRLTQREVVEFLGCANNTARNDLRVLVDTQLIKRVITSGNLSSAYFILA